MHTSMILRYEPSSEPHKPVKARLWPWLESCSGKSPADVYVGLDDVDDGLDDKFVGLEDVCWSFSLGSGHQDLVTDATFTYKFVGKGSSSGPLSYVSFKELCPPRQKSRVGRLKAKVEPPWT